MGSYRTWPVRQAPLWRGDTFTPGMFGARYPGGRDPFDMARPNRDDRRRRIRFLDADGKQRTRRAA